MSLYFYVGDVTTPFTLHTVYRLPKNVLGRFHIDELREVSIREVLSLHRAGNILFAEEAVIGGKRYGVEEESALLQWLSEEVK